MDLTLCVEVTFGTSCNVRVNLTYLYNHKKHHTMFGHARGH